jgi:hypothetical protein
VQSHDVELVNPPEPEMQTAIQEALPSEGQSEGLNCNVQHKEKTVDLSCELQFAIQEVPAPDVQPALQTVSRPVAWIARRTTVAERRQADDEREAACWRYLQQGRLNTATLHAGGMHDHERGKHLIARLEQQAGRRSGHDRGGGPEP